MILRIAAVGIAVVGTVAVGIVAVGIVAEAGFVPVFGTVFESSSDLDCYYIDRNLDQYFDLCYCYYSCTFIYLLKLAPPILGIVSIVSSY